ncbi:FKBP-type peptidyl-prolyl cis-trans isomerase [Agromyces larvae]|uniref:peptidylprolyl isomerase n=1 Tax=Agromyces larvae TaxID=2929802 RepID=A0ABY4BZ07_9MICO|nr:FKBP-type peptidyl-prolyl cis-trans isomerase [Agromyces larvae]UOE42958.1 FKBP-type peptidyl-prolyl cis-trans isomerase [Agromyces larvae]
MNRALRLAAPVALAASAALLLAGCAGGAESTPTPTPTADGALPCFEAVPGPDSEAITVDGAFGEANPTATFTTPLKATDLQTTVLTEGDGDEAASGTSADVVITMINATTGEQILSQQATLAVGDGTLLDSFRSAIDCQPYGSRTVTVAPPASLYGETGNETLGVGADDTVVIVVDIVGEYVEPEPEPLPTPAEWTENVPEVTQNGDDAPTIVIPDAAPSAELALKVLDEGDGTVVQNGDSVTVHYVGINWDTKEQFDSSFDRGEPATFGTADVIQGFGAALVGQPVGTKLIVTIPPELGYGTEESSNGLGGHTLVFYVEIVDTAAAG